MSHPRLYKYHTDGEQCFKPDCSLTHVALEWFRVQWVKQDHSAEEAPKPAQSTLDTLTPEQRAFLEGGPYAPA